MKYVTLQSGQTVAVRKILCLGRNYAEHAREMDSDLPEFPIVFLKPSTAVIGNGDDVVIPSFSSELHHEVELVVLIGKEGKFIPQESAREYIEGYAVGLDMTLRDVQSKAKKDGLPWTVAKGFDTSAPVSTIVQRDFVEDPLGLDIELRVNGRIRQKSNTRHMIFPIEYVVSYLSNIFTLERGDLLFTGTPEGVGQVSPGDVIDAQIGSIGALRIGIRTQTV